MQSDPPPALMPAVTAVGWFEKAITGTASKPIAVGTGVDVGVAVGVDVGVIVATSCVGVGVVVAVEEFGMIDAVPQTTNSSCWVAMLAWVMLFSLLLQF